MRSRTVSLLVAGVLATGLSIGMATVASAAPASPAVSQTKDLGSTVGGIVSTAVDIAGNLLDTVVGTAGGILHTASGVLGGLLG